MAKTFVALHNGNQKLVKGRFGGDRHSEYNDDWTSRADRIERRRALEEMAREASLGDHSPDSDVYSPYADSAGSRSVYKDWRQTTDNDFGGVRVIIKNGKIVAAFAGRSDSARQSQKRQKRFCGSEKALESIKPASSASDLVKARRLRRKAARATRWLQALPPNHHSRVFGSRWSKQSLDPITGRRYRDLPAAQREEVMRLRLANIQKQMDLLPPHEQADLRQDLDRVSLLELEVKLFTLLQRLEEQENLAKSQKLASKRQF